MFSTKNVHVSQGNGNVANKGRPLKGAVLPFFKNKASSDSEAPANGDNFDPTAHPERRCGCTVMLLIFYAVALGAIVLRQLVT